MTRLRADAWKVYAHATRGEHFAWWAGENLIQGQDRWAGKPLVLEVDWQAPIMYEALAVNADGAPYWSTVVILIPRKAGKTLTLAALAAYALAEGVGEPEILLAAGSDKQAGRLYGAAAGFIRRNPELRERMVLREYVGEIARADGAGKITRLSSEGDSQHGANPSLVVIDELHVWRTPRLRRSWGALTTADGARKQSQVFAITTEGEKRGRDESILGQLITENEANGELERLPGVTISRDHDSRTILFHYAAVDAATADPGPLRRAWGAVRTAQTAGEDTAGLEAEVERLETALLESVMPANPASWLTPEYLLRQARSAKVMPSDFLQLHANIAADSVESWIPSDRWDALVTTEGPRAGCDVALAVDASYSHDTTAVAVAWRLEDGRIGVGARVWSARPDAPAHEYEQGGNIVMQPVRAYIEDLSDTYNVREVAFDPAYFRESAETLAEAGVVMVRIDQQTDAMRQAEQAYFDAVMEGRLAHLGDPVVDRHLASVVASRRVNGSWRIRKVDQGAAIDAVTAIIMAHDRLSRLRELVPLVEWV